MDDVQRKLLTLSSELSIACHKIIDSDAVEVSDKIKSMQGVLVEYDELLFSYVSRQINGGLK